VLNPESIIPREMRNKWDGNGTIITEMQETLQ
jgi:hypothetical protein